MGSRRKRGMMIRSNHRVIILNRGSMPRKRQFFPTKVCNVTTWRHSGLRAHWLMALVGRGGGKGKVCILRSPELAAFPISLFSIGGVCGRKLTEGKILFTGRQTCSLYLVLWLWESKHAITLTNTGFQIILYHRYDWCNYVRFALVRLGLIIFICIKIRPELE